MAARLTDRQKKKIVADYLELQSVNATARKNNVSWDSVKRVLEETEEIQEKLERKKEQNTADILEYMDGQRNIVCEIIAKGLAALNNSDKLANATPSQITTAIGTLIDKWAMVSGSPADTLKEDSLSASLREMAEGLESD